MRSCPRRMPLHDERVQPCPATQAESGPSNIATQPMPPWLHRAIYVPLPQAHATIDVRVHAPLALPWAASLCPPAVFHNPISPFMHHITCVLLPQAHATSDERVYVALAASRPDHSGGSHVLLSPAHVRPMCVCMVLWLCWAALGPSTMSPHTIAYHLCCTMSALCCCPRPMPRPTSGCMPHWQPAGRIRAEEAMSRRYRRRGSRCNVWSSSCRIS